MVNLNNNYLSKQPGFVFKPSSIILFIVAAIIVSVLNIAGQIFFPSQSAIPYFAHTTISLIVLIAFVVVSIALLKQNRLSPKILGLLLSSRSFLNIVIGVFIGMITLALLMLLIYVFVPYHYVAGTLNIVDLLKACYSYCLDSCVEEFLFRGFLLVILSQLIGWRIAVFIMAVPFGLFHLLYLGINTAGLKMVITTAAYSFVFSYAYILTGSMWTAISTHVSTNILLHAVLGLDGGSRAMFIPVFDHAWPSNYDLGMIISVLSSIIVASFLFLLIKYRRT